MADTDKKTTKDFWIIKQDKTYAGEHLLIDIFEAENLSDIDKMEQVFRSAVTAAGATLLHIHLHHFGAGYGLSGVAVLAESHISVHTWPESGYAAFDIFMCGKAKPELAVAVIEQAFPAKEIKIHRHLRGERFYEKVR